MEEYIGGGGHIVVILRWGFVGAETLTGVDPCHLKRCIDGRPWIAENQVKSSTGIVLHDH
jgi:hypothetical protein